MTKKRLQLGAAGIALFLTGIAVGQGARHPNLFAAQKHIEEAMDRISAAQRANEFDMGGHAAKAKELLEGAHQEVKMATEVANHR